MKKLDPINVKISDIKKVNGIGWWPDGRFLVNANVEGCEPMNWYEIPFITEKAQKEAEAQGVSLGDIADQWNERLREDEKREREASGLPYFEMTATLTEEQMDFFKKAFSLD
jgi:hypothetical protein